MILWVTLRILRVPMSWLIRRPRDMPAVVSHSVQCLGCTGKKEEPFDCCLFGELPESYVFHRLASSCR